MLLLCALMLAYTGTTNFLSCCALQYVVTTVCAVVIALVCTFMQAEFRADVCVLQGASDAVSCRLLWHV